MFNITRCAACKYLRRRCGEDCTLAPYFPYTHPERFAFVHRIFGASNVSRMLQELPANQRAQAADAIASEAYWRVRDPVYGSVGVIYLLQQEIQMTQRKLAETHAQITVQSANLQTLQQQLLPLPTPTEAPFFDAQPNDQFSIEQSLPSFYQPSGLP